MGPVLARQALPRGRKQLSQGPWQDVKSWLCVHVLLIAHGADSAGEGRAEGSRLQRKAGWRPAALPGEERGDHLSRRDSAEGRERKEVEWEEAVGKLGGRAAGRRRERGR